MLKQACIAVAMNMRFYIYKVEQMGVRSYSAPSRGDVWEPFP